MNEKVPRVEIKQAFGLTPAEVGEKKHNIWVGISISNKKFTPENIRALIFFALEKTKEKVLVLIPGRMQATNYRYFDKLSRAESLRRAFEDEKNFKIIVQSILGESPEDDRRKVSVANYDEICTPKHIAQREIFFRAFAEQGTFYEEIIKITEEVMLVRGRVVEKERAESLSLYILHELPMFVDGVQAVFGTDVYTLVPYPGSGKLDQLKMDIIKGEKFPELTKQLKLENKVGILDVEFV